MLKKALKQFSQNKYSLIIIVGLLILVAIRFVWLNEFPVGVLHDEIDVSLSSKYYFEKGTDISGIKFPKSLFVTNSWASISGLPSYLLTNIYGPFSLTPLVIRIPYVVISLITALVISLLVYEITKLKKTAILSCLISLMNPWLYFYSRQPTEAPFSLLFALFGTYLFLKLKNNNRLWSLIFFVPSFYSYFGAKPVIPIFIILFVIGYNKFVDKLSAKTIYIFVLSSILLVVTYFWISRYYGGGTLNQRENQLTFLNFDRYSNIVNIKRRESIDFPFRDIFYNKYTVFVGISIYKVLGPFSPNFLFLSGDSVVPFEDHGVLYYIDLPLILLGIYYFIGTNDKKEKELFFLTILLLISGAVGPGVSLMGDQFVFRAFLQIPAYIILIAYAFSKMNYKILIVALIIYVVSFVNFLVFFFFRYSISQQDNHFITERVIASYIKRVNNNVTMVTSEPERLYYQAEFYNDDADRELFVDKCLDNYLISKTYIVDAKLDCKINNDFIVIQNQKDSGVKYKIINDKLCNQNLLTNYRRNHLISDYNIEAMDDKIFCNRWIQNGKTN